MWQPNGVNDSMEAWCLIIYYYISQTKTPYCIYLYSCSHKIYIFPYSWELFFFIIFQKEVDQPTIQYRQVFRYCRHPGDGDSFFPVWAVLRQCEAAGFRGGRRWRNWPGAEEGDSPSRNTETVPVFFGEVPGVGFRKRHLVKTSPDVLQRSRHRVQGTNISEVHPPGGRQYQPGCQVNKLLIYVCIVSDHEKKCGCIQEWRIDGAGLLTFRKPNMTSHLYNITIHFTVWSYDLICPIQLHIPSVLCMSKILYVDFVWSTLNFRS